jgi:phage FluMu protein Com
VSLENNDYIVLSGGELPKRPGEGLPEILTQWLVKCPQCFEVRLVVGAQENDQYICKDCGHRFAIRPTTEFQCHKDAQKAQ